MRKLRFLSGALGILALLLVGAFFYVREHDIPRATLEKRYADTSSRFVMLRDGTRAHVRDQGLREGPPLVLVHGSNASSLTWQPWVKQLGDAFRIITLDMPGHGLTGAVPGGDYSHETMVKFLAEVTNVLGLTKFALGGSSMGGRTAAGFCEDYPELVTHLILVDASGLPFEGPPASLAFRIANIPILNRVLLYITPRSLVINGLNEAISEKDIINDEMIDSYWDFVRMEGTRAALLSRLNTRNKPIKDRLGDIKIPTLILWGEEDRVVPLDVGREFHRLIQGSKLIVFPKTGHIPQEETPHESAAAVRAFL
jgi:pimeloyl-ACP methyl ester carboxylesterase